MMLDTMMKDDKNDDEKDYENNYDNDNWLAAVKMIDTMMIKMIHNDNWQNNKNGQEHIK